MTGDGERRGQAGCWGSNTSDMRARAELAVGMGHPVGCWLEESGGDRRNVGDRRGWDRRQHAQKSQVPAYTRKLRTSN